MSTKALLKLDFTKNEFAVKEKMPDTNTSDRCVTNPEDKFRTEMYFVILDRILSLISTHQ